MPQSSPSVLVIRLDGIGDALALTPLLAALRTAGVPVDLALGKQNARIFAPGAIRHVDIAPFVLRSSARDNLEAIAAYGAALQERGYTHVLVATEDPGGYRLAHATRVPQRVGFINGWGKPLKTLWVRSLLTRTLYRPAGLGADGKHECETLFALATGLTNETSPTDDLARLRPMVVQDDVARGDRVAIQITQKWERFGASAHDVARLVRDVASREAVHPISPANERAFADAVESAAGMPVERFDDLASWKNAIASAGALVAPDSGATHVAGMVGTPTVALFPPMRHLDRQIARWHPWAARYEAVTVEGSWGQRIPAALARLRDRA